MTLIASASRASGGGGSGATVGGGEGGAGDDVEGAEGLAPGDAGLPGSGPAAGPQATMNTMQATKRKDNSFFIFSSSFVSVFVLAL